MNISKDKQRILVDLKIAMNNGFCGIAKENRLIFKMLSQAKPYKVDGLLVSANAATVFTPYQTSDSHAENIAQANRFFHESLGHDLSIGTQILKNLKLARFFALLKKKFNLYSMDALFKDVIWRQVFDKSLSSADKDLLLQADFHYTDLTVLHAGVNAYFKKRIMLDTTGYDFALFLEPTVVSVSPATIKLVRYHDAIPITEPDFSGGIYSRSTINTLNLCAADAYFICNSEPTRKALLQIRPDLEAKAFTVPCALSNHYQRMNNEETLRQILVSRFSSAIVKSEHLGDIRKQILKTESLHYIFNLATLDPKKNHVGLIKAWEKLNYQNPNPVKLVIAANRGWFSKEIQDLMRPHIEMGNIIHIDNLSVDDLPYLFSHAKAFVFPSYSEGFGLPPLEAAQCECPTIVSDIPAHRWVMGEAALYCNPYDVDSMRDAMAKLVSLPGREALRERLVRQGLAQVKRYADDVLSEQWAVLLDKIKALGPA